MDDLVVVRNSYLNITSQVLAETPFICECGWVGVASNLLTSVGFSCCPVCFDLDVRLDLPVLDPKNISRLFD
jgi:hypothetical protein